MSHMHICRHGDQYNQTKSADKEEEEASRNARVISLKQLVYGNNDIFLSTSVPVFDTIYLPHAFKPRNKYHLRMRLCVYVV